MVNRTRFVAEFTTNHMGNLNVLLRMAERAAAAGCDLIKMQKKDVESFYSAAKLDAPYESPYGHTYRDYRTIFEFDVEDFHRFDRRCRELGVSWFTTVQDIPSLEFMARFDLPVYKVASSNARNHQILSEVARQIPHDREIVVSVAGSTLQEIEQTLAHFPHHTVTLLHCVARYPCPSHELRLGNIEVMRRRFGGERVHIGYSGHEIGLPGSFAAVALGAEMVERHFCLSRHSFVHHIECSLEPAEFRELVETVHAGERLDSHFAQLPDEAFASSFGMTPEEREFLVEQTYSRRHVGAESEFHHDGAGLAQEGARRRAALSWGRAA
ncbi:MAG: N-acetylneuraminate synthase family protein [Burkholderiaceae bacterium]